MLRTSDRSISVFFDPRQTRPSDLPRELLVVPIRWRERIEGVLAFDMGRRRVLTSERSLVRLVANQLGAAFRARDTGAASSPETMQLQGSLRAAASVQQSLLPAIPSSQVCGLSIAACTIPAEVVGGDYYDFICVEKKKLGIVIADIQGKGLAAALFGNLLRTTTHFLTRESPSPAVLLGKINTILHREATSTRKLFSMFYAMYDARTGLLTYSGSGHVSPVVVPHNGSAPHRLRSDGALFGVSAVQMFREHSTHLAAGDLVMFFTDGVIEHAARDGEVFGEDRLLRTLVEVRNREPEAILQVVKETLHAFAPLPSSDDITIIVARVA
jgi:serine phosphatase RsbU (regulator of sigma subunit)